MNQRTLKRLEYHRILDMLEKASGSTLGKELAKSLAPSHDLALIEKWQAETWEAKEILRLYPDIPLGGIKDIRNSLRKVQVGGILEPTELLEVADSLYAARRLSSFLREVKEAFPHLQQMAAELGNFRKIETEIARCIIAGGEIADNASAQLNQVRRQIRVAQSRVREKIDHILRSAEYQKMLQDPIVTIRGDRYVVPVKNEYRAQFGGIVHDQSASGATLFIEPLAVVEINNEVRRLLTVEKQEIIKILSVLTEMVRIDLEAINATLQILAQLDFVFAKGKLSQQMDGSEPKINTHGYTNILRGRHPLIQGKVVPISVSLGKDFDLLVITGPNTGGKTVTLKTVGLFTLMAQSGLHIPADPESQISIFDDIFTDIGDEQSIEQSLSTFSGHMTNIVSILQELGRKSLVLLDELGAGTDPTEGANLAIAILEEFHRQGAKVIATTHYSELKNFAYQTERVENASVEFDIKTLRPTYRLLIGRPGRSNAFEIAQRLGLSPDIVTQARSYMTKEQVEVASLFEKLELNQQQAEREHKEVSQLRKRLEEQESEYRKLQDDLAAKKAEIIAKAEEEAWRIITQAKRETDAMIQELKAAATAEAQLSKAQAINQVRENLRKLTGKAAKRQVAEARTAPGQVPNQVKPGQTVFVPRLKQKGHVVSLAGQDVVLQIGIMKTTLKLEELRTVEETKVVTSSSGAGKIMVNKSQSVARELDLRGMTVDEAALLVDKYLDDAYLAGLSEVNLIHGKGTGTLRSAVKQMINKHPHVKSSRLGEYGEGGIGVTVVQIKSS